MSYAIEDRANELKELLNRPEVQLAMRERCEEQGHDWDNCCSITFEIFMKCKWCGEERHTNLIAGE